MSKRDKRKERKGPVRHTTYVTNRDAALTKFADYRQWPIIGAYVPIEDCFRGTGYGTAGIVRRTPTGKLISSFFHIELHKGGITNAFGKDETDQAAIDGLLDDLKDMTPPCEPGSADLAARYIWGAYAWSYKQGYDFPDEMKNRYLRTVPPLSGTRNWWLQQFTGANGLVPPLLLEAMRRNPAPDEVPEDKDLVIFTTLTFDLRDRDASLASLRNAAPEFSQHGSRDDGDVIEFGWSRAYPKNHWSPLSLLGGRQSLGTVTVKGKRTLIAEAKTLSMAAVLVGKLKTRLGDRIHLRNGEWMGTDDLLKSQGKAE